MVHIGWVLSLNQLGVFLRGIAEPGDVVALYQGTVYLTSDMSLMSDMVFNDNGYVLHFSIS